jgi:hypothetical protein
MLHPVGDLAASVYWRRRIVLLAALVLIVISLVVAFNKGGGSKNAAGAGSTTSAPPSSTAPPSSLSAPASSASSTHVAATTSTASVPVACARTQLSIATAADAASYPVGASPNLSLVVTNKGPKPCVMDLSDKQIELRVYAGSARVWGSHDCQIAPGTSNETLPVGQKITRAVQWSGLSSQPACAGVRQRVPAGTYTVTAYLAGTAGTPATFAFTG